MGVEANVVRYMKAPPSRAELNRLVSILEGPVEDLVRKDSRFKTLGLDAERLVGKPKHVAALLAEHPELMQRPVLVRGDRAIVGRPKDRVNEFLAGKGSNAEPPSPSDHFVEVTTISTW